jgi:hypothetical protein
MTAEQIKTNFIGKRTEFTSADMSDQFTAIGMWDSVGAINANWKSGGKSGVYSGHYTLTGDKYCITDSSANGGKTHCGYFREQDGKVYEINEDGTLHGVHTFL